MSRSTRVSRCGAAEPRRRPSRPNARSSASLRPPRALQHTLAGVTRLPRTLCASPAAAPCLDSQFNCCRACEQLSAC